MKILSVEPRDIYITVDLSFRELEMILNFLDNCEVKYDGEDKDLKESITFTKEQFFTLLNKLYEDLKKDGT